MMALALGALATGRTRVHGAPETADVLAVAASLEALGVPVGQTGAASEMLGRGAGGLSQPRSALDFGASAESAGIIMGVSAGQPITVTANGAALSSRMTAEALRPLGQMGLDVLSGQSGESGLTVRGTRPLIPITCELPAGSETIAASILLAGLSAPGETTVIGTDTNEAIEGLLKLFGAAVRSAQRGSKLAITVTGEAELQGADVVTPGDPMLAAHLIAAALIVPGSDVTIEGVLVNSMLRGMCAVMRDMGGKVDFKNMRCESGLPVADLHVRASRLGGIGVSLERTAELAGLVPLIAAAAAFAEGETRIDAAGEHTALLSATAAMLSSSGGAARIEGQSLIVQGAAGGLLKGGNGVSGSDGRICLAALVMGLACEGPVAVSEGMTESADLERLASLLADLGAKIR